MLTAFNNTEITGDLSQSCRCGVKTKGEKRVGSEEMIIVSIE